MKHRILLLALLAPSLLYAQRDINFDADWSYILRGQTHHVTLPRAWNEDYAYRVIIDDLPTDTVRYVKDFTLPKSAQGKKVLIEFEGARQMAKVWLNGHLLGMHENGITAFGFDLTPYVRYKDTNHLEVLTDNSWNYHEEATGSTIQWNNKNFNANYGGLSKHVRLHIVNKIYQTLPLYSSFHTTGTYVYARNIDVMGRKADIHVESQVRNETTRFQKIGLEVDILDIDGQRLARFESPMQVIEPRHNLILEAQHSLSGLHFWSWGYGYLYTIVTRIFDDRHRVIDEATLQTGFRKTEFSNGLFKLNDRTLMVHGYAQRTSNEWPAVGISVPAWLSDYSNGEIVKSGGNLVRWMHIAPWRQDVESCDRVGLLQAMPAGDAEKDVTGRRWDMRKEVMRDAIILFRNNPSIVFYESGNAGITDEHMQEMKAIRDEFDPWGGRAIGCREMLASDVAEYGGEMLYINKSGRKPVWAMEYCRDEALRRYWDDWTYPYHRHGDGPLYRNADASAYNQNCDQFAIEHVRRWFDYWQVRPGTGKRVSSGGVKIVFSDTNTHRRGESNYRTSGVVDAMRLPKDSYFAHQVMWDGWVTPERSHTHIIGHWNYKPGTVKPVYVVSDAPVVKLYLNGMLLSDTPRVDYHFLHTFPDVPFQEGTLRAVSCDTDGRELSSHKLETVGEAIHLQMSVMTAPHGMQADGADLALVTIEAVDAQGRRSPVDFSTVNFTLSGPAQWRGGISYGGDTSNPNRILSPTLTLECGVARVLVRSTRQTGTITLQAQSPTLLPATVQWESVPPVPFRPAFQPLRGETPDSPSFVPVKRSVAVASVTAGSNEHEAHFSIDDNEASHWQSDGHKSNAWICYQFAQSTQVDEVSLKLRDWRSRSYPLEVVADDGSLLWSGTTPLSLGYVTLQLRPQSTRSLTLRLRGASTASDGFGQIRELDSSNDERQERGQRHDLRIVECDFLQRL